MSHLMNMSVSLSPSHRPNIRENTIFKNIIIGSIISISETNKHSCYECLIKQSHKKKQVGWQLALVTPTCTIPGRLPRTPVPPESE